MLHEYFGLSEEQTKLQIRDRFSFLRFLSLSSGDEAPDKNTIRDFKNMLSTAGVAGYSKPLTQA